MGVGNAFHYHFEGISFIPWKQHGSGVQPPIVGTYLKRKNTHVLLKARAIYVTQVPASLDSDLRAKAGRDERGTSRGNHSKLTMELQAGHVEV